MTRLLLILPGLALLFSACNNGDQEPDAYGNFEAIEVFISSEVTGKLIELSAAEGETVKEGELLAIIDSTQLFLKKEQINASIQALRSKLQNVPVQLDSYRERLKILERERNRVSSLLADSAATQKQLDDITGEIEVVNSQIVATESSLSTANRGILAEIRPLEWQVRQLEDQLTKCKITAPIQGTILNRFKEKGELAAPGQPLFKLANLEELILRGYISGSQLTSISMGQEVSVQVDAAGGEMKEFSGMVTWISGQAEFTPKIIQTREERVNQVYAVKFRVKNDGSLKIGMPAEVNF